MSGELLGGQVVLESLYFAWTYMYMYVSGPMQCMQVQECKPVAGHVTLSLAPTEAAPQYVRSEQAETYMTIVHPECGRFVHAYTCTLC